MTMRALPLLCALLLGVGTAILAGCGGDRGNLLPQADAQAIKVQLQAVQQAAATRQCDEKTKALSRARAQVKALPPSVDDAIVERLLRGLDRLRTRADEECAAAPEVTTTTVPTTTAPAQTPTQTTPEPPPDTTDTTTTPSTPTVPDTPTDPGTGGGVSPDPGATGTTPPPDGGASPPDPGATGGGG